MKKILMTLLAVVLTTATFAQQGQGRGGFGQMKPEDMAKRQAEQIKKTCEINDEQYKKIYDYYLEQSNKMQEEMKKAMESGERQNMDREAMQKRREAQTAFIKSVLTEEQFKKYEEEQKNRRQRGGQGGQGRPQGGPGGPGEGGPQEAPQN